MPDKKKILLISDILLIPSGVGSQSRYICEGLLKTGKYTIRQIGGAVRHPNYNPIKVDPWGDDLIVFPRDGYGDKMFLRMMLDMEKPDVLMLFTDPRFFIWVWEMADEILPRCPILYYHVWDNNPPPRFNESYYKSCNHIACISKLTHNAVKDLGFEDKSSYIPHAVPSDIFKPLSEPEILKHKEMLLGKENVDKFVVFWNNRNARRKNPSDVICAMKQFNEKHDNSAILLMHCNPFDTEGANLIEVMHTFKAESFVKFSSEKLPLEKMNVLYNMADVTLNIAFAEGFGLSSVESITAGTCIANIKTGGLQDQVDPNMEENNRWGLLIEPCVVTYVGGQQIPYIAEDRISHNQIVEAVEYFHSHDRSERRRRGLIARKWATDNFNIDKMINSFDSTITKVTDDFKVNSNWADWRFHAI